MPGPRNAKRKKQVQAQKEKRQRTTRSYLDSPSPFEPGRPNRAYRPLPSQPLRFDEFAFSGPSYVAKPQNDASQLRDAPCTPQPIENHGTQPHSSPRLPKQPCIENTGDAFLVRNVFDFLDSHFAAPPSLDNALCAEFAQDEVLDMLCTVLPEETAAVRSLATLSLLCIS